MTLHMLQFTPDLRRLIGWADRQGVLHSRQEDDFGYAIHALLRAAFDAMAPAPFALIRHPVRPTTLLAYSAQPTEALHEQARTFAEPNVVDAIRLQEMAGKAMPMHFARGRRLGFTLRARPIVRTDRNGDRDRSQERDAFLAAITRSDPGCGPSRGDVYQEWLAQRLEDGGAALEHVVLESFRLTMTLRRDRARALRPMAGPDASFSGVLRVTDPERFVGLLAHGVGRHRAFGFGMLLLKPV